MSPEAPAARVVCTLGMHRSGTSLVSGVLNLLGVHLGPRDAVAKRGDDNPKGYWEHQSFVELNEEILGRFGGRWDAPPSFPPSWSRDARLDDLREVARALVARDFAGAPLWGWKDPRTCLTLPFWQEVVGPMRYVLCFRNPSAVAASLARRNAMPAEQAERLWLLHVELSLAHTSGQPRVLVSYEDLLDDWQPPLRRLAESIGRPEAAEDPEVRAAVGRFVEKDLCHHPPSGGLQRGPRLSSPTKAAYNDLVRRAEDS